MLIECIVAVLLIGLLLSLLGPVFNNAHELFVRSDRALNDMEMASRCLETLKRDLRFCGKVEAFESGWTLLTSAGRVTYRFDPVAGSVVREGADEMTYADLFDAFRLIGPRGGLVSIELSLRKRDPESPFHPVWKTEIFCPNVK